MHMSHAKNTHDLHLVDQLDEAKLYLVDQACYGEAPECISLLNVTLPKSIPVISAIYAIVYNNAYKLAIQFGLEITSWPAKCANSYIDMHIEYCKLLKAPIEQTFTKQNNTDLHIYNTIHDQITPDNKLNILTYLVLNNRYTKQQSQECDDKNTFTYEDISNDILKLEQEIYTDDVSHLSILSLIYQNFSLNNISDPTYLTNSVESDELEELKKLEESTIKIKRKKSPIDSLVNPEIDCIAELHSYVKRSSSTSATSSTIASDASDKQDASGVELKKVHWNGEVTTIEYTQQVSDVDLDTRESRAIRRQVPVHKAKNRGCSKSKLKKRMDKNLSDLDQDRSSNIDKTKLTKNSHSSKPSSRVSKIKKHISTTVNLDKPNFSTNNPNSPNLITLSASSIEQVNSVEQVNKSSELAELDELAELNELDELNKLYELDELDELNKLYELDRLNEFDEIAKFSCDVSKLTLSEIQSEEASLIGKASPDEESAKEEHQPLYDHNNSDDNHYLSASLSDLDGQLANFISRSDSVSSLQNNSKDTSQCLDWPDLNEFATPLSTNLQLNVKSDFASPISHPDIVDDNLISDRVCLRHIQDINGTIIYHLNFDCCDNLMEFPREFPILMLYDPRRVISLEFTYNTDCGCIGRSTNSSTIFAHGDTSTHLHKCECVNQHILISDVYCDQTMVLYGDGELGRICSSYK